MKEKIVAALSSQVNFELYSAYLYYAMADRANRMSFTGATNWFNIQTREELIHAAGLAMYLQSRRWPSVFESIAAPKLPEVKSPGELFDIAVKHEAVVTSRISALAELAHDAKDFALANFINFYLGEQTEEEYGVGMIADQFKMAGKAPDAMLAIDQTLATRVLTLGLPVSPGNPPVKI